MEENSNGGPAESLSKLSPGYFNENKSPHFMGVRILCFATFCELGSVLHGRKLKWRGCRKFVQAQPLSILTKTKALILQELAETDNV